jgi:hypothetical protein
MKSVQEFVTDYMKNAVQKHLDLDSNINQLRTKLKDFTLTQEDKNTFQRELFSSCDVPEFMRDDISSFINNKLDSKIVEINTLLQDSFKSNNSGFNKFDKKAIANKVWVDITKKPERKTADQAEVNLTSPLDQKLTAISVLIAQRNAKINNIAIMTRAHGNGYTSIAIKDISEIKDHDNRAKESQEFFLDTIKEPITTKEDEKHKTIPNTTNGEAKIIAANTADLIRALHPYSIVDQESMTTVSDMAWEQLENQQQIPNMQNPGIQAISNSISNIIELSENKGMQPNQALFDAQFAIKIYENGGMEQINRLSDDDKDRVKLILPCILAVNSINRPALLATEVNNLNQLSIFQRSGMIQINDQIHPDFPAHLKEKTAAFSDLSFEDQLTAYTDAGIKNPAQINTNTVNNSQNVTNTNYKRRNTNTNSRPPLDLSLFEQDTTSPQANEGAEIERPRENTANITNSNSAIVDALPKNPQIKISLTEVQEGQLLSKSQSEKQAVNYAEKRNAFQKGERSKSSSAISQNRTNNNNSVDNSAKIQNTNNSQQYNPGEKERAQQDPSSSGTQGENARKAYQQNQQKERRKSIGHDLGKKFLSGTSLKTDKESGQKDANNLSPNDLNALDNARETLQKATKSAKNSDSSKEKSPNSSKEPSPDSSKEKTKKTTSSSLLGSFTKKHPSTKDGNGKGGGGGIGRGGSSS